MLKRLYIDNFHCLTNFELNTSDNSSLLFIGENGAGKSSVLKVLSIIQRIGCGDANLENKICKDDFNFARKREPMSFEIELAIDNDIFIYFLSVEYPENFLRPRIAQERLTVNGEVCYDRSLASVSLTKNSGQINFTIDWHYAALPLIQTNNGEAIDKFRSCLKNMILISPVPQSMESIAMPLKENRLDLNTSNFVSWFADLLAKEPQIYVSVIDFYKEYFKDCKTFSFELLSKDAKELYFSFENTRSNFPRFPWNVFSEGEKLIFLMGVISSLPEQHGDVLCFWDEPNNYLSAHLLDSVIRQLRIKFRKNNCQLMIISHNLEVMNGFNDENTLVFRRRDHFSATLPLVSVQKLKESGVISGDLTDALKTGDAYNAQ